MKHKLHYSVQARKDLDDIWDYIVSDLGNPSAAENTVNRIMDAVDQLMDFPEMGSPLRNRTRIATDYRSIVVGNYMAFYRLYDNEIYVARILYGRRDYMRILFERKIEYDITQ